MCCSWYELQVLTKEKGDRGLILQLPWEGETELRMGADTILQFDTSCWSRRKKRGTERSYLQTSREDKMDSMMSTDDVLPSMRAAVTDESKELLEPSTCNLEERARLRWKRSRY